MSNPFGNHDYVTGQKEGLIYKVEGNYCWVGGGVDAPSKIHWKNFSKVLSV